MKNAPNLGTQPDAQADQQPASAMDAMRQMRGKLAPLLFLMTLLASAQQAQAKEKNVVGLGGGVSVEAPVAGFCRYDKNNDGYVGTGDSGHHWLGLGLQAAYKGRADLSEDAALKEIMHRGQIAAVMDSRDLFRAMVILDIISSQKKGSTKVRGGVGAGLDTETLDLWAQFLAGDNHQGGTIDYDFLAAVQTAPWLQLSVIARLSELQNQKFDFAIGGGMTAGSGPVKWYAEAMGTPNGNSIITTGLKVQAPPLKTGLPKNHRRSADRKGNSIHMR